MTGFLEGYPFRRANEPTPETPTGDASALLSQHAFGTAGRQHVDRAAHKQGHGRHIHNQNGSQVDIDAQGNVRKIARPDGTSIEAKYVGHTPIEIIEHRLNDKLVDWKKDQGADRWRTMTYIGSQ